MRIEKAELFQLHLPLIAPFQTSYGVLTEKKFDLLILKDELGNQGVGELVSFDQANYIEETIEMSRAIIKKELILLLQDHVFSAPTEVHSLFQRAQGNFMAKSAIETAVWDLYARRRGVSLQQLFAGRQMQLSVGVSMGIEDSDAQLLKKAKTYVEQGYTRLKLKIKPGYDLRPLKLLRKEFPDLLLMADANSAYTINDLALFDELDQLELSMIEQPFATRDFVDHAQLQRRLKTPICLDENIRTLEDVKTAHALGSCRAINLKIPRVGGITEAQMIVDYCREQGLLVWLGGMFESGVGRALNLQFASQAEFTFPGDISASRRYYHDDIIEEPAVLRDGKLVVPNGIGNGITLAPKKVERYCTKKERLIS